MKKGLVMVILCALVLLLATGCSAKDETLRMEVEDIVASGDNQLLTLNIQNNTSSAVSYGWAGSCKIKVTTDNGSYICDAPFMGRIRQGGSTETIKLANCSGEVKSIVITELCLLEKNNLPGKELHDLTLYNSEQGITAFEDSFGFFDDPHWSSEIMSAVVPAFIVFAVAVNVLKLCGVNVGSMLGNALSHFPAFHGWAAQTMHDQAVQMANDAHMREVDRQFHETVHHHTQEAMDFGMRSVTPIDQGGFVPPPPEPPMFF